MSKPPISKARTTESPAPSRSTRAFATEAAGTASLPSVTRGGEIAAHDGSRVRLIGTYVEIDARMRQAPPPRYVGHVAIVLADGTWVSLLPTWSPDALRPEAEVGQFKDRVVEVVGTLHAIAPAEPHGGASLMNPAVTAVEALRAAP